MSVNGIRLACSEDRASIPRPHRLIRMAFRNQLARVDHLMLGLVVKKNVRMMWVPGWYVRETGFAINYSHNVNVSRDGLVIFVQPKLFQPILVLCFWSRLALSFSFHLFLVIGSHQNVKEDDLENEGY